VRGGDRERRGQREERTEREREGRDGRERGKRWERERERERSLSDVAAFVFFQSRSNNGHLDLLFNLIWPSLLKPPTERHPDFWAMKLRCAIFFLQI
jgi:hypothetical protein